MRSREDILCKFGTATAPVLPPSRKPSQFRLRLRLPILAECYSGSWQHVPARALLTRDLMEGGPLGPPGGFSSITQIRLGITLWNFQYLSGHQFYASSQKILSEVTQGQKL